MIADKTLVVLARGGLGDLLCGTPVLEALKSKFPETKITALVQNSAAPLLKGNPAVSGIIRTAAKDLDTMKGFFKTLSIIKKEDFSRAVVLWSKAPEAWLVTLAGIPVRVGQDSRLGYSFLYTHKVRVRSEHGDTKSHWADILLDYARALGAEAKAERLFLYNDEEEKQEAEEYLKNIGINPENGFVIFHSGKGIPITPETWPTDHFAGLAAALRDETGMPVLLTGTRNEEEAVFAIAEKAGDGMYNICGKTSLRLLCSIISKSSLLLCPDSGPAHIAAALGVPTIALFGLKSDFPDRWRPLGTRYRVLVPDDYHCSGSCIKENCTRFVCYEGISAESVREAAAGLLSKRCCTLPEPDCINNSKGDSAGIKNQ